MLSNIFRRLRVNHTEQEQALLRVFFATLIFSLIFVHVNSSNSSGIRDAVLIFSTGFLVFSIIFLMIVFARPTPSEIRQNLAIFADLGATTFVMLMTEEVGILFYGIYLWVIVGNGLRYGTKSLILAYILSIFGFITVIIFNDYWLIHRSLAAGLSLTLILIPLYILKLLNRLNLAILRAEEASKAKSYFLANMSHEMRTPLHGVIGASDLILQTPLNAEQKDLVRTLKGSGDILLKLIDDVLDFSKIESGKLTTEIVNFDLHAMISGIMDMFALLAEKKGLGLHMTTSPKTSFMLRGDAQHLRQIIINLIGNAIKFTKIGMVELRISTREQSESSTRLKFEVIDTGIGIPVESQQVIFESFTQAHSDISTQYGGTGLGTTISKQLVQLMGGEIGLYSTVDQGSTFWFELPFEKQQETRVPEQCQLPNSLSIFGTGMSENEQANLAAYLTGWGGRLHHMESVKQLLIALREIPSGGRTNCVVLCKPQTLGMNSKDFAELIWSEHPSSKISLIMLDHDPDGYSEAELLKMGHACLLKMPLDKTQLFNAIHSVISSAIDVAEGVTSFKKHYEQSSMEKRHLDILVADDNGTNRMIISKILQRAGHSVDLVDNGEQALDCLENKRYDLAIMDMHMPIVHGIEALKIYRMIDRNDPPMPFVILTANATIEAKRECEEAGVDAFLTKPIDAYTLLETVARLTSTLHKAVDSAKPSNGSISAIDEDKLLLNDNTLRHLRILGGESDNFLEDVMQGFLLNGEQSIESMKSALHKQDYKTFKELAHALQGSSGNVGAEALHEMCREISRLDYLDLQASARELLNKAQDCFGATRLAMIRKLETPQQTPLLNKA